MTEKILSEAKKIMDEFVKALSKVKVKEKFGVERSKQTRDLSDNKCDPTFKKRMLANAPKVKDDYLVMEKKKW